MELEDGGKDAIQMISICSMRSKLDALSRAKIKLSASAEPERFEGGEKGGRLLRD